MRKVSLLLLVILLSACNLPPFISNLWSATATETPTSETGYTECGWSWANQPLPDLSAKVESAMEAAGLTGLTASAEAYGENCITASGEVDHFAALETDFQIRMEVRDLADTSTLGDLLVRILMVLDAFPPGVTPGTQSGYVGVTFQAGSEETRLWFTIAEGVSAREQGLHGAALLNELQK